MCNCLTVVKIRSENISDDGDVIISLKLYSTSDAVSPIIMRNIHTFQIK